MSPLRRNRGEHYNNAEHPSRPTTCFERSFHRVLQEVCMVTMETTKAPSPTTGDRKRRLVAQSRQALSRTARAVRAEKIRGTVYHCDVDVRAEQCALCCCMGCVNNFTTSLHSCDRGLRSLSFFTFAQSVSRFFV